MKKLGMWAVVAFVGFLIGMSAESEVKPVSDVIVKNVEALASVTESEEYYDCYGSGKVECMNKRVYYKLTDPNGLGDNHETE